MRLVSLLFESIATLLARLPENEWDMSPLRSKCVHTHAGENLI